jgi:hypothetical protein
VTLTPGAQLSVPWNPAFSAFAFACPLCECEQVLEHSHEVLFGSRGDLGKIESHARQSVDQPVIRGALGDHRGQEREQRIARILRLGQ